jgi:hypothetical protein
MAEALLERLEVLFPEQDGPAIPWLVERHAGNSGFVRGAATERTIIRA